MQKNKEFNLDAGWQLLLNRVDYQKVVDWFKLADIDPRELILLFKDLYDSSPTIRKYHVKQQPRHFLKQLLQNIKMNSMGADSNFDEIDKHREAKEAFRGLLEILNAKYAAELRKDPNKDAEFLYSKFSPF